MTKPSPARRVGRSYPDRRRPRERVKNLDPMDWLLKVGTVHAREVSEAAGTSYEHFKHIAHGRRRPSIDLAKKLVAASDGGMSLDGLLGIRTPAVRKRAKPAAEAAA